VVPSPADGKASLDQTRWELVFLSKTTLEEFPEDRRPYLVFEAETSRIYGNSGCNRFSGGYTIVEDNLRIVAPASTKMACFVGMQTEDAFLSSLLLVRKWQVSDKELKLLDCSGDVLIRFVAKEKPAS
jgi:heat shock protein HslJ